MYAGSKSAPSNREADFRSSFRNSDESSEYRTHVLVADLGNPAGLSVPAGKGVWRDGAYQTVAPAEGDA
jgi:hypothetical protein